MKRIFKCELPWPPSVNTAYGQRSNRRRYKSKQYKDWLANCPDLVIPEDGMIVDSVQILYMFYLPDKRKRDLSNYIKVPEDYLVSQCIIEDDNHTIASEIILKMGGIDRGNPRVEVEIWKRQHNTRTDIRPNGQ